MADHKKILVLGIGNDIMHDDAVGLIAARQLRRTSSDDADFHESFGLGLELLDELEGYEFALILDSIMTGKNKPGSIIEYAKGDFSEDLPTSPHYAGIPEVFKIAERLQIPFPNEVRILALEIENPYLIHEGISEHAERSIPSFVDRAKKIILSWKNRINNKNLDLLNEKAIHYSVTTD